MRPTRRDLVAALLAAPLLAARATGAPEALALTPACDDGDDPTPPQTAGPFYLPNAPERRDLAADRPGARPMTVGGLVLDRACRPLPGAIVELWHCDETGAYDTTGFRLRGWQRADAAGRWWFDTIEPGLYPGRTRHVHLRAQRAGRRPLVTQLYFPGEPGNARDRLFDPRLLVALPEAGGLARYDLVLA